MAAAKKEEVVDEESLPSGVFVYVTQHEDGTAQVVYQRQGAIDPLSIPILLEMGARVARDSLGLPN